MYNYTCTTDCELVKDTEKKHGLVCQIRGRFGMKSKLTPVVPFIKPEVFTEEKEENKNGFISKLVKNTPVKLMSFKIKVPSTPVKIFVEPNEKDQKGPLGRLYKRTRKALNNILRKIK